MKKSVKVPPPLSELKKLKPAQVKSRRAKEEEILEYLELQEKIFNRQMKEAEVVLLPFKSMFGDEYCEPEKVSIAQFVIKLSFDQVRSNMHYAVTKVTDTPQNAWLYFCKMCWNQINGKNPVVDEHRPNEEEE